MGICVNRQPSQVILRAKAPRESAASRKPTHVAELKLEEEKALLSCPLSQETKVATTRSGIKTIDCEQDFEVRQVYGNHLHVEGRRSETQQSGFADKAIRVDACGFSLEEMNKVGLAFVCKKGLKPESPNQDDFCITLDGDSILMGVFDGHGTFGHDVSSYIHTELPRLVRASDSYELDPTSSLRSAFPTANEALKLYCKREGNEFDCELSGTTASMALLRGNKVIVAHVGDSRVVLGRRETGKWTARQLTVDHKPTNPEEKERIERSGGEVKQLPDDIPFRVFLRNSDDPGLSMSRSLGDSVAQSIGVLCEADLLEMEVQAEDEFLLLCSDGVWEFISNEEAVELVGKFAKSQGKVAAEKLAQLAWMRWLQHEEDVVDDITVLLAFLPKP